MRIPRPRFTIRRMMALVLLAALILGAEAFHRAWVLEKAAEASYKHALLVREVAEYALKEYAEETYPAEDAKLRIRAKISQTDAERAAERLEWSKKAKKGPGPGLALPNFDLPAAIAKERAKYDAETTAMQLVILEKYTRDKMIKSLRSDVEKAQADEAAKLEALRRGRAQRWRILGF